MAYVAAGDTAGLSLSTFRDLVEGRRPADLSAAEDKALTDMFGWTRSFLMSTHPELGRTGDVCPFTARGARLDTLRFGVSGAGPGDFHRAAAEMFATFEQFDAIDHPDRQGVFRAILVAFPQCDSAEGRQMLLDVQKHLRPHSLRQARMMGLFHTETEAEGLWNPGFRPLRSPVPILALRALVEQDSIFVLRHPLLAPTYLMKFKLAGGRRIVNHLIRKVSA